MSVASYYGKYTDIGLGLIPDAARPGMRVRPVEEAFGPDGLVSARPVDVVSQMTSTGQFIMQLIPSGELKAAASGRIGVDYVIEVGRFEESLDGYSFSGADVYRFTAVAGGGNVGEMAGGSLLAVWVGPPWPDLPLPDGLYIDKTPPNDWGIRS